LAIEFGETSAEALRSAQAVFRDINDRLAPMGGQAPESSRGFLCECGSEVCLEMIEMTGDEYRRLRANPLRFAVMPDEQHVFAEIERVVAREDGYWIVEQHARAGSRWEASSNGNGIGAAAG
jgi:hypothetical protein